MQNLLVMSNIISQFSDYFRQSINDWSFRRHFPHLLETPSALQPYEQKLRTHYTEYVSQVSTPEMAVSSPTAALLILLCEKLQFTRVVDLGSGFSSFALRSLLQTPVEVWSVDDDPAWLNKTAAFLQKKNANTDHLLTWDDFAAMEPVRFDLIFHDLGSMETRFKTLPHVLTLAKKGCGLVVLDDMHKRRYSNPVKATLKRSGFEYWNLKTYIHDDFSRFCSITIPSTYTGRQSYLS